MLQDEPNAPGHQQTLERAAIEEAQEATFQEYADGTDHDERQRQRDEEIGILVTRESAPQKILAARRPCTSPT